MVDFHKLKKTSSIQKLSKAIEQQTGGGKFAADTRYWQPEVDKAGNGFAVIRFLDAPKVDGEDADPFVVLYSHSFKGPTGQWYIENSRTTVGQDDPVSELNSKLWGTGTEDNKSRARNQARRTSFISNILVVNDPAHPENNGKVFLYSYGKKIMAKIKDKAGLVDEEAGADAKFKDPDAKEFNPFNFWEGADFKLTIRKVEGYRNYDKSEFKEQSGLFGGDDKKIEKLWEGLHSLKAEIAAGKFKPYAELKTKMEKVLGLAGAEGAVAARAPAGDQPTEEVPTSKQADAEIAAATATTASSAKVEDDDEFAEFAALSRKVK